jgi:predicted nucleic acid-binding protein
VSRQYLDTSAAAKLLVEEPQSAALAAYLDAEGPELVACALLETELRRVAVRLDLGQEAATAVLDGVTLYEVPPSLFREAGLLPGPRLRSLDAIHVAAAGRLSVGRVIAYDERLLAAARGAGLHTVSPSGGTARRPPA